MHVRAGALRNSDEPEYTRFLQKLVVELRIASLEAPYAVFTHSQVDAQFKQCITSARILLEHLKGVAVSERDDFVSTACEVLGIRWDSAQGTVMKKAAGALANRAEVKHADDPEAALDALVRSTNSYTHLHSVRPTLVFLHV
jgi:hypothetical protein